MGSRCLFFFAPDGSLVGSAVPYDSNPDNCSCMPPCGGCDRCIMQQAAEAEHLELVDAAHPLTRAMTERLAAAHTIGELRRA